MASLIGALRVTLSADTAQFSKGMSKAQREAAAASTAIEKSLGAIRKQLAKLGGALTIAAIGLVIKRALDYASSLGEVSQQLGVTTRELQVYRYAAGQVGISQEEMDKGLAKLTLTMGKARQGVEASIRPFKELSSLIGKDILKSARGAGEAIPLIADAMAKIPDPTRRAQLEMALFGKAGQKLDTLLASGSAAINELAKAAEELGIILSDEQIQRADETADKLEAVKMVLEARIAGAVADNADAILALVDALSALVVWAGKASLAWQDFLLSQQQKVAQNMADGWFVSPEQRHAALEKVSEIADKRFRLAKAYEGGGGSSRPRVSPARVGGGGAGAGAGGRTRRGGGGRDDAERKRKEALRDAFEIESDQRRADIDILRAKQDIATEHQERADLDRQILALERDQELAALQLKVNLGETTEAQAAILRKKYEELDGLKHLAVTQEVEQRKREELAELQDTDAEIKRELLEGQAELARTQAERRRIELAILDLAYEEERRAQQRIIDDPDATAKQQQDALARIAGLSGRKANDRASIIEDTMGPLEAYLKSIPQTAEEVNEALESIAANGLQSLSDGIVDAIMGAKSLGEVFKNVAKQIIADLIRIAVQRAIIEPLANALFSSSGGGSIGSAFSSIFGGGKSTPGFAKGGSMQIGGMAGIDRNLLSLNGQPLARVSRGERIKIDPQNDNGPGALRVQVEASPDLKVTMATTAGAVVAQAAPGIAARARGDMLRDLTRRRLP